jgi:hypothetical protein
MQMSAERKVQLLTAVLATQGEHSVALLVAGVGFGEVQMLQQLWPH